MLQVVQDEEHFLLAQVGEELGQGRGTALQGHIELGGQAGGQIGVVFYPRKGNKVDAVEVFSPSAVGHMGGQPRFATAPQPDNGDEPCGGLVEQCFEGGEFGFAADEGGGWAGQVVRDGLPRQPNAVVQLDGFGRGGNAHLFGQQMAEVLVVQQGGVALASAGKQAQEQAHGRLVEWVELQSEAAVLNPHFVLPPIQPFFGQF